MSLRFTLRQLEYFVAVSEEGSISKAATRASVSAPSISVAIAQLEDDFGLKLFVRKHAHGLTLTQAGRELAAQARVVLAEARAMRHLAERISGQVQGVLTLGCLLTVAQLLMPRLRRSFEALYPQVTVVQTELDQLAIFAGLRRAEIDLALTYDMDIPKDIQFLPLASLPPYVLLSPDHPLAGLPEVSPQMLQPHPMVLLDLPHSAAYFLAFFDGLEAPPYIAERTKDMAVMRSLVAHGYGYSIANIQPQKSQAPDGRPLRLVPLVSERPAMQLGIAVQEGAGNMPAIRAFVAHCRSQLPALILPEGPR